MNLFLTKRSKESTILSITFHSIVEILHETFTSHKNNFHRASISIAVKNIIDNPLKLTNSQILTISIIVRLTTNLQHTRSMRNRFAIIPILKGNLTISIAIILGNPKTLLIHYTHSKIELTHLFINPKIRSTAISILKLILRNNVSKITSNLLRITMELKLRSHLTRSHRIAPVTLRIRLTNSRSTHTPILTFSKHFRVNKSIRIRIGQLNKISITIRRLSQVFLNTKLSLTIRTNKTILLNKPVTSSMNLKFSTTKTRLSISCIKVRNKVSKLHTTHRTPSPLNSSNVINTRTSLTLCHKRQRKAVIVHTIIISQKSINFNRFLKLKISNTLFIRVSSILIQTLLKNTHFVHNLQLLINYNLNLY